MKADIIQIGNSHGVRIPKKVLEECGLRGVVDMNIKSGKLIIAPLKDVRSGWDAAFKKMSQAEDDVLILDDHPLSQWDEQEWTW